MPRYEIDVDKEKAALSGVTTANIASILRVLFSGETVGRLHVSGEKNVVPIRLLVPRRYELNPEDLHQVFVNNAEGRPIPVSELIKVSKTHEDLVRFHKDNERVTFVGAELATTAPIYAIIDLTKRLGDIQVGLEDKLDIRKSNP